MNMLIGVLCEVVSAVGDAEKEETEISLLKGSVLLMLKRIDENQSGDISKDEFGQVFEDPLCQEILELMQVDVTHLQRLHGMKYSEADASLTIEEIMDLMLQY